MDLHAVYEFSMCTWTIALSEILTLIARAPQSSLVSMKKRTFMNFSGITTWGQPISHLTRTVTEQPLWTGLLNIIVAHLPIWGLQSDSIPEFHTLSSRISLTSATFQKQSEFLPNRSLEAGRKVEVACLWRKGRFMVAGPPRVHRWVGEGTKKCDREEPRRDGKRKSYKEASAMSKVLSKKELAPSNPDEKPRNDDTKAPKH